jgi:FixJ family two-component response regulator
VRLLLLKNATRKCAAEKQRVKIVLDQMNKLTRREREVLAFVVAGLQNGKIAATLGNSEKIKVHRSRMFKKMGARSVAELVRMTAGISL